MTGFGVAVSIFLVWLFFFNHGGTSFAEAETKGNEMFISGFLAHTYFLVEIYDPYWFMMKLKVYSLGCCQQQVIEYTTTDSLKRRTVDSVT